jgi:putative restriction endonuclease
MQPGLAGLSLQPRCIDRYGMVQLFVAVTDQAWFDALSASAPHDEVNFWQPSGSREFRALRLGELFLFKLHAPNNFIAGGGVFGHASNVPLSIAWEAFGAKNGVATVGDMRVRIARYRRDPTILDARTDPLIGCRIITQPFFLPREEWMKVPESWSPNIVTGKGFDAESADGKYLWDALAARMASPVATAVPRYGPPMLVTPRLGQGAFRLSVTDCYERSCAVTGERTLPILDAAHIRAYGAGGEHVLSNGILLRTDIHRLFDLGYVTVGTKGTFEVSRRLKEDFDNGRHYYELQGTTVRLPKTQDALPSAAALSWHRENRYLG